MLTKTEKKNIVKNFNFQNFKNPECSFVRTIVKKIQERFESFRLRFVRGAAFRNVRVHKE